MVRPARRTLRPIRDIARGDGTPLRAGDIRGAEGLQDPRRHGTALPSAGEHRPHEQIGGAHVPASDRPRTIHGGAADARQNRSGLGVFGSGYDALHQALPLRDG
ncbi:hypothetical protein SDC9_195985 [bioreactor metagenome]|uniref:Uncharacterized protein n=1 Tax=bioreactor metagenome TaxID=1076179 RepID=A0A645IAT3_9ZZZZ